MPGYFKPFHYYAALSYVTTGAHETEPFQRYLQTVFADLEAKGIDPKVWE
jgi:4-alpha-glucanotransferase